MNTVYVCEYAQMTTILYRESLGPLNSDYVIYRPPLTNMVGYLCIFSPLKMLRVLSSIPLCFQSTSLCLSPPEYARRYLLGKQVVLWPNQSHWLAAFSTLHSLLSFLAARGKAFGAGKVTTSLEGFWPIPE